MDSFQEDTKKAFMNDGITIDKQKDGKVNIILDMSMWDLFELCKARYNYRHNMNMSVPMSQKSQALDSGGLAHEGLEVYFKMLKQEYRYQDRMDKCIERMRLVSSDPDQCNLNPEETKRVMQAVEESCHFWRFEDEMMRIHEVERAFAYVLYEDEFIRIIISGKIDILVDIPPLGRNSGYTNIPVDHKTFSRDFEVLTLSNQFMNYCVATSSNYLYVNRIGLHDPEAKKPKPAEEKFLRVPMSYDNTILEDFKQNLIAGILYEYLPCVAEQRWRMNFTSCFKFNRKCEYYDVCETSGAENKLSKLEQGFVIASPWDVTAKLKKN